MVAGLMVATCLSAAAVAQTKKEYRYTVGARPNISVETQYGSISVKPGNANEVVVTATLKSNDVEVDHQQNGNLTLEGADAVVDVRDVQDGHVHVWTMRGPITLTDVRNGHVEISSISGDVHLKSVSGPLIQANTSRGKIFYDGDLGSGGDYKFTTHKGDIEVLVPSDVSADFQAHSVLGRVQHDFPLKPRHSRFREEVGRSFIGTSGQAASEVVLRSFSGRIRLKQR
jgi:DUF4097 and DUF4098 domain-containing protein YvlB